MDPTQAYREQYRATISPHYLGPRHAGLVSVFGLACIWLFAAQLQNPSLWQASAFVFALLLGNLTEYLAHRYLGHHRRAWAGLFYQRHTLEHHHFFTEDAMTFRDHKDWRVILFPFYLIVAITLLLALPAHLFLSHLEYTNLGAFFAMGVLCSYLLYEVLHFSYHLPLTHPVYRLRGMRYLRALHQLHHSHAHMRDYNFNLVYPLCDHLFGTYKAPEKIGTRDTMPPCNNKL